MTRRLVRAAVTVGAVALWLALPATAGADARRAKDQAPPQSGYVGAETCVTCHEGFDHNIGQTKHGFAADPRTPAAQQGCESCHGPGEAHANDPANVKPIQLDKVPASESNATCTSCHNRAEHALWDGSQHDSRNVGCVSCHSVHDPKSAAGQLKAVNETGVCASCHRGITNKQHRFNHMPVREGKLECASCHNPHGSTNVKLLRTGTTVDESCTSCHADKRGPYLWEHAPVSNSCVTCHDPHGSNNDRMLVAKMPFLCQRCHVTSRHPPTVYDGYLLNNSTNGNKIFGKSCVSCHQAIHGSNHPNGKAFLR
ncbi:MAG: DmsE family decaheme c-type cytochrome [Vicinamibacterales bacterium]